MIRAVVFDIDNTLIDWSGRRVNWFEDPEGHYAHLARAARTLNPAVTESQIDDLIEGFREAYLQMMENDLDDAPHLGTMLSEQLVLAGITQAMPRKEEALAAYNWVVTPGVRLFADTLPALETLHKAGYYLGIVTNGYQPMSQRDKELAHFGLLPYFSTCRFSSADVGKLKPDSVIFQTVIECLGVLAEEAVYVGDHLYTDILGAQQVGMKGVWRVPAHQDRSNTGWIKPDGIINRLTELPEMLRNWS